MTEANKKKLYCGATDLQLSEEGKEQLRQLEPFTADLYISSSLARSIDTLKIMSGKGPDIIMSELNEMDFGSFEMKSYDELKNVLEYINWINGDDNVCCPNGESRTLFLKRVERGFQKVLDTKVENVAVVCHGGVIAVLMDKLFPNQRNFYQWQPGYGRGYTLKIDEGRTISWINLEKQSL